MFRLRRYLRSLTGSVVTFVLLASIAIVVYTTKNASRLSSSVLHPNENTYGIMQRFGTFYEKRFENWSSKQDTSYSVKQNGRTKDETSCTCIDSPLLQCLFLPQELGLMQCQMFQNFWTGVRNIRTVLRNFRTGLWNIRTGLWILHPRLKNWHPLSKFSVPGSNIEAGLWKLQDFIPAYEIGEAWF